MRDALFVLLCSIVSRISPSMHTRAGKKNRIRVINIYMYVFSCDFYLPRVFPSFSLPDILPIPLCLRVSAFSATPRRDIEYRPFYMFV